MNIQELVRSNDVEGLKELLTEDNCVSLESGDIHSTPLHTAAWKGYVDIAEVLIKAGADITAKNKKGLTPCHVAVTYGRIDVLKLLISYDKSAINLVDFNGNSLLNVAAQKGHNAEREIINFLIEEHADISIRNKDGNSAYHYAVIWNRLKVLIFLLNHDHSHINERTNKGQTLLHLAALKGYNDIVKCLLLWGAERSLKDNSGNTAFQVANIETKKVFIKFERYKNIIKSCIIDMACFLATKKYEDNNTALHIVALFDNSWKLLYKLVENKADLNARNDFKQTPLHLAVLSNDKTNVKVLLRLGANTNVSDNEGKTPLMYAIEAQSIDIVNLLLKRGANLTTNDRKFNSAIHYAIHVSNVEIIETLLKLKSSILNDVNEKGLTPLMIAVQRSNITLTKLLLSYGANPSWKNKQGRSASFLALSSENQNVIQLLKKTNEKQESINFTDILTSRKHYLIK